MRETDLYAPVKALLTRQGYEVKGEIGDCDVVAVRGDEAPVIVELKTSFSLALVFQGVARQSMTETVYLAVPPFSGRGPNQRRKDIVALCRRLGLGLMTVRTGAHPFVDVLVDPGPYRPRRQPKRTGRLLREFERRVGDPTAGGTNGRPVMTAYRQDALRCARHLADAGPTKAAHVAAATAVERARTLMASDVYGWFERVERGVYALTPKGHEALTVFADAVADLDGD